MYFSKNRDYFGRRSNLQKFRYIFKFSIYWLTRGTANSDSEIALYIMVKEFTRLQNGILLILHAFSNPCIVTSNFTSRHRDLTDLGYTRPFLNSDNFC